MTRGRPILDSPPTWFVEDHKILKWGKERETVQQWPHENHSITEAVWLGMKVGPEFRRWGPHGGCKNGCIWDDCMWVALKLS